jgi:predicted nucleic acid-binding protein
MSVVVSDASPVHYLILTNAIHILPSLFSKVVIPAQVVSELQRQNAPPPVRTWMNKPPSWMEVRIPTRAEALNLHMGEEHAIALALELRTAILVDEKEARNVARQKGLVVIGTLGLLERAADKGLINFRDALTALRTTNMRISRSLIDTTLNRNSKPTAGSDCLD